MVIMKATTSDHMLNIIQNINPLYQMIQLLQDQATTSTDKGWWCHTDGERPLCITENFNEERWRHEPDIVTFNYFILTGYLIGDYEIY